MNNNEIISLRIQNIENDLALLRQRHIYEIENIRGVPKCATLADRIQRNFDIVLEEYDKLIEKHTVEVKREQFDLLSGLLVALSREISELSKKQPDGLINKFKIGQINRVLKPIKEMMKDEPSTEFLDILVEPDPEAQTDKSKNTYSDATMILSQFKEACGEFRSKHFDIGWHINL